MLIKAGANSKLADNEKRTALDYAKLNKNTPLIILLDH
jgi:ankyrin repeat protein